MSKTYRNRPTTVTRDGWNVSSTSGHLPGMQAQLSVFKTHNGKYRHGDLHGRIYPTADDASAAALAHGYSQSHLQAACPHCGQVHRRAPYEVKERLSDKYLKARPAYVHRARMGYLPIFDDALWRKECRVNNLAADIVAYDAASERMRQIMLLTPEVNHAFKAAWLKLEAIKNRHGGMPPKGVKV